MMLAEILSRYMRLLAPGYFKLESPVREKIRLQPETGKNYSLYIHIPFCTRLCSYCSFYKELYDAGEAATYFDALVREIKLYRELGFTFNTIYIGGGTPTLLAGELAGLLETLQTVWPVTRISMETNPDHLTEKTVSLLKQAGVQRLSVGIQSFNDALLGRVNRTGNHTCREEITEKLLHFKQVFPVMNIDMIFNFPGQDEALLLEDLEQVLKIKTGQVTYYPLMLSGKKRREFEKQHGVIDYRKEYGFYRLITRALEKEYHRATVWCFTRDKQMIDEYIVEQEEYIGVGAGAFSYLKGRVLANVFSVPGYIKSINQQGITPAASRTYNHKQQLRYYFLFRLFGDQLPLDQMKKQFGNYLPHLWKEFCFFLLSGSAYIQDKQLCLTEKGRYFLVALMREFFNAVNLFREKLVTLARNSESG